MQITLAEQDFTLRRRMREQLLKTVKPTLEEKRSQWMARNYSCDLGFLRYAGK